MSTLLLAVGFDPGDWVYLIVLGLGAVGGILGQRKKKKNAEKAAREAAAKRRPLLRPQAPAAARPPGVPRPPRPPGLPPAPSRARPVTERAPAIPSERPEPGRLRPARWERVAAPVSRQPPLTMRLPGLKEPRPVRRIARPLGPQPGETEPQRVSEPPAAAPAKEDEGAVRPRARRESAQVRRLNRVLGSDSGLRAAVVLSEILAPPVALREKHLL